MRITLLFLFVTLISLGSREEVVANETFPGKHLLDNEELLKLRLEGMNTIFAPEYSEEFKKRFTFLLKTKREYTESLLGRMVMYFPEIDSILEANNIPTDLKYVTIIESTLRPKARSRAGAVGLWQFMRGTAIMNGISVNSVVDERKDPYAATHAAVRYFKNLYEIYGDWALVLMAYNSGPGRVNRAIKRSGGKKSYEELKAYLPKETQDYIPKFLAASFFLKNYTEFGYNPEWPSLDLQLTTRKRIYKKVSFREIRDLSGIQTEKLQILNPSYRYHYVPRSSRGYYLTLPTRYDWVFDSLQSSIELRLQDFDVEYIDSAEILDPYHNYIRIEHRVKGGQTMKQLADLFKTNHYKLKYWNKKDHYQLVTGEKIIAFLPKSSANLKYISLFSDDSLNKLKYGKMALLQNNMLQELPTSGNEDCENFDNTTIREQYLDTESSNKCLFLIKSIIPSKMYLDN